MSSDQRRTCCTKWLSGSRHMCVYVLQRVSRACTDVIGGDCSPYIQTCAVPSYLSHGSCRLPMWVTAQQSWQRWMSTEVLPRLPGI